VLRLIFVSTVRLRKGHGLFNLPYQKVSKKLVSARGGQSGRKSPWGNRKGMSFNWTPESSARSERFIEGIGAGKGDQKEAQDGTT